MRAGIALGSNLGRRLDNLRRAFAAIRERHGNAGPLIASPIYETEAVESEAGASAFLNAVVEIEFEGLPISLLDELMGIEKQMGRPSKRPRNAPRIIDLDVLYAGNLTLSNEEIVIPHPRIRARRFVLAPLADIRPELVLPGFHRTAAQLLCDLPPHPGAVRLEEPLET